MKLLLSLFALCVFSITAAAQPTAGQWIITKKASGNGYDSVPVTMGNNLLLGTNSSGVPVSIAQLVAGVDYIAPAGNGSQLTGLTESQIANLTTDLAGKLSASTLASWTGSANITTLGTVTTGTIKCSVILDSGTIFNDGNGNWTATAFFGDGANITGIDAGNITTGTLLAARMPAFTGDATSSAGATALTLATVNSNVGSFGSSSSIPVITVNAKGLVTAVTTASVSIPSGANPTASLGLTAINGTASTFMRSDAAPPLNQGIVPTWTGQHTFTGGVFSSAYSSSSGMTIQPYSGSGGAYLTLDNYSGVREIRAYYANFYVISGQQYGVAGSWGDAPDVGYGRASAGVGKITNGSSGTGDLLLRYLTGTTASLNSGGIDLASGKTLTRNGTEYISLSNQIWVDDSGSNVTGLPGTPAWPHATIQGGFDHVGAAAMNTAGGVVLRVGGGSFTTLSISGISSSGTNKLSIIGTGESATSISSVTISVSAAAGAVTLDLDFIDCTVGTVTITGADGSNTGDSAPALTVFIRHLTGTTLNITGGNGAAGDGTFPGGAGADLVVQLHRSRLQTVNITCGTAGADGGMGAGSPGTVDAYVSNCEGLYGGISKGMAMLFSVDPSAGIRNLALDHSFIANNTDSNFSNVNVTSGCCSFTGSDPSTTSKGGNSSGW